LGDGPNLVTSAPTSSSAIRFDSDNLLFSYSNNERMRIDSSGNVGIGCSPTLGKQHTVVSGATGDIAAFGLTGNTNDPVLIMKGDASNQTLTFRAGSSTSTYPAIAFDMGTTGEAMRIDSSGNLLVGKASANGTSGSSASDGFELRPTFMAMQSNTIAAYFNTRTDGTIVSLQKDGAAVGSIGTQGSRLSVGSGDVNLNFNASANSMYPISNPTTGALSDGAIDVGAATARFKDLYLSGGVYLGGTGAANKLDDYEEGTWTASSAQLTITSQDCVYEKVGNLVHVSGYIVVSASSSSVISISNLIFSAAENSSLSVGVSGKTTSFERIDDGGSIATFGIDSNITSSTEIYFSASYRTS